jgi:hypothetical protein
MRVPLSIRFAKKLHNLFVIFYYKKSASVKKRTLEFFIWCFDTLLIKIQMNNVSAFHGRVVDL